MSGGRPHRGRRVVGALVVLAIVAWVLHASCAPEPSPDPGAGAVAGADGRGAPRSRDGATAPRRAGRAAVRDGTGAGTSDAAPGGGADASERGPADPSGAATPASGTPPKARSNDPLVHVHVRHPDGTPAAGATVLLLNDSAVADANGEARVPWTGESFSRVPVAWLGADAAMGDFLLHRAPTAPVDLTLARGVVVRGRTVNQSGTPLVGAALTAEITYPHSGRGCTVRATSDAEGRFEFPPLPRDGRVQSFPDKVRVTARYLDLPTVEARPAFESAADREIVLEFFEGAVVCGRLLLPDGTPAKGRFVAVAGIAHSVRTGDAGRFEIRLPRDTVTLLAKPWNWVQLEGPPFSTDPASGWSAFHRLGEFRGDSGDRDLRDVKLGFGRDVAGEVVDSAGRPVEGAEVEVRLAGVTIQHWTTDAAGRFTALGLGDDDHEIVAADRWRGMSWRGREAVVGAVRGGAPDLRIVLGRRGVVARLVPEDGTTFPRGTLVEMSATRPGAADRSDWAHGPVPDPPLVRFEPSTAGAWDLTYQIDGFESATLPGVVVRDDADVEVEVRLRRKP